jgi:hypothetical protein
MRVNTHYWRFERLSLQIPTRQIEGAIETVF